MNILLLFRFGRRLTLGRLQVSGNGGARKSLVVDCGLLIPGADPGFQVIGGVLKKFRENFGVFCVKNQDFMQKIIFFQF